MIAATQPPASAVACASNTPWSRRAPTSSKTAVGSVVGQLAKAHGCHAVGIAGGAEKCAHAGNELGFDVCIDRNAPYFEAQLEAA